MPETVFLCGDVMTGRGVDQIMSHPSAPRLYESYVRDARAYVELAEEHSGPLPRRVAPTYIWGDALNELARMRPQARVINLETSITVSDAPWPGKAVHYRMHPRNVDCLKALGVDACALANNHVLDFGRAGLLQTLEVLRAAGIRSAGAGTTRAAAESPATLTLSSGARVVLFSVGSETSGIPPAWAATDTLPGIDYVPDESELAAVRLIERIEAHKRSGDIVIVSIHWGPNWGFEVPRERIRFAHLLIDGGADLVHGHSSHHPLPIEVYHNKLILYWCGDFIDDYEGISGYEQYRDDLVLMYFPTLEASSGALVALEMTPMQIRRMRLRYASEDDVAWMHETLARICGRFGTNILRRDARLVLQL